MKSLSALYDWLGADHPATGGSHRTEPPNYHLRSLPGEEIHLYVKNIDNTKIIRVVDKKDWATSISVTGAALVCSLVVSAMVGPSCYGMLASRRMEFLREERARLVRARKPEKLVEDAVHGMLPKTKMGEAMYRKLKVYAGSDHPHAAQKPSKLEVA